MRDHVLAQLERIEKDRLNALLYVRDRNDILEDATTIQRRIDEGSAGRLAGRTFIIKANINCLDMPISCASRALESYMGTYDADVIERIKAEDGLIIGIANCDEFASGSSGLHSAFGATLNPHDNERIPGGSSSGSAVAVAARYCDVALGTDTGGSVRNPASHCGVVAIKPSYGRVSRHGVIDLSMSLDQVGPIASNVHDALLTLQVIAGHSRNDATSFDHPVPDLFANHDVRFAVLDTSSLDISDDIRSLFSESISRLGELPTIRIPNIELGVGAYYPLVYTEFYSATRRFDGRRYGKPIDEVAGHEVKRRIAGGKMIAHAEDEYRFYRKSLAVMRHLARSFDEAFNHYDAILSPVVPRLPRRIDESVTPEEEYAEDAITIPANLAGICAASVPAGTINGLPVGLQILSPRLREDLLASAMRTITEEHLRL